MTVSDANVQEVWFFAGLTLLNFAGMSTHTRVRVNAQLDAFLDQYLGSTEWRTEYGVVGNGTWRCIIEKGAVLKAESMGRVAC